MAVEPSLMASSEYSTWKRRPSGEKVLKRQNQFGIQARREERTYFMPRSGGTVSCCLTCWKLGEVAYHILTVL